MLILRKTRVTGTQHNRCPLRPSWILFSGAILYSARALVSTRRVVGDRGSRGSASRGKLPDFDSLWDYDHPGASERRFRELLPAALDSRDFPYLTQLLTQIARAEG